MKTIEKFIEIKRVTLLQSLFHRSSLPFSRDHSTGFSQTKLYSSIFSHLGLTLTLSSMKKTFPLPPFLSDILRMCLFVILKAHLYSILLFLVILAQLFLFQFCCDSLKF